MPVITSDSVPVTPSMLTAALYAAGTLQDGAVVTVEITKQLQTPISHLWFLEVGYTSDINHDLPSRLVVKWAIADSPAPDRGGPELVFYRELARELPSPPMIRCLATAAPSDEQQWLILEDL